MKALRVGPERGGVLRTYYLHVPANTGPGAPLVIVLHGAGSSGQEDAVRYGWRRKAQLEHFIVAAPDASPAFAGRPVDGIRNPRVWNDGAAYITQSIRDSDDTAMIATLIAELARSHRIDRSRVYVAGFSSGGNMAGRLAQEMPDRIAAMMVAAGQLTPLKRPPSRGIPLFYFTGDADPLNPVEGGKVKATWGVTMVKEPHRTILERWRTLNGCPSPPMPAPDRAAAEHVEIVGPCRDGSEVRFMLVRGLAHAWPVDERAQGSATLSATNEAWGFFRRFQLPAAPAGN